MIFPIDLPFWLQSANGSLTRKTLTIRQWKEELTVKVSSEFRNFPIISCRICARALPDQGLKVNINIHITLLQEKEYFLNEI